MRIVIVTALLAGSLVATAAHAGAYLESTEQELGSKEAATVSKIWFEGGRMRTERRGHDGGSQLVVFRNQAMYLLDPQTKTYRVIDKATAERMGSQVAEAKKKMDERMAGMPPVARHGQDQRRADPHARFRKRQGGIRDAADGGA